MGKVYQIRDWNDNFESAKSRTYDNCSKIVMPNKHGLGYRRLMQMKDGPAVFGAWCSVCQLLSRHGKPRRGYLTDTGRIDGVPYTPDDLSIMTFIPKPTIERMLSVCSNGTVSWLKAYDAKDTAVSLQYPHGIPNTDKDTDTDKAPDSGKEASNKRFMKPSIDELRAYSQSIDFHDFTPSAFIDHYESNGWKVGRASMKDWKATVRNWKRGKQKKSPRSTGI